MLRMTLLLVTFFSLSCSADESKLIADFYCPDLKDINPTTLHYHEKNFSNLFFSEEYRDNFASLGISLPIDSSEIRLLTTENDSAVCQKFDERLSDMETSVFIYDLELNKYSPVMYRLYYQLRDKYIVFTAPYSSGSEVEGRIGPPSMGWIDARFYETKNLNFVGAISF